MYSEEGDREQLARLVQQWNENRLDLFHLSYPTQELEIEGVMRFYFQVGRPSFIFRRVFRTGERGC